MSTNAAPHSRSAVPALVLAGGKTRPEFAALAGVSNRALADINGLSMVRYVLRALQSAETVSRVILAAPTGFPDQPEADERIAADGDLVDNLLAGLRSCAGSEYALLATADIPFVTPQSVDDYVRRCRAEAVDCCYAAVTREACDAQFPGMKRTWLHTPAGTVTGGNVVLQRVSVFEREAEVLRQAYEDRKNPRMLVRIIGTTNLLKLLARRLTLEDIASAASRVMDVRCRLVLTPHADLATDIDRPEDLVAARERLRPGPTG